MFILNKKNGVITECNNEDVINHCKKHSDEYAVGKKPEELKGDAVPVPDEEPEEIEAEAIEPEEEEVAEEEIEEEQEEPEAEVDYSTLSVAELRKVAKEKGIQGYANMNKETLIEVIKAHE